jgi:hypothetical protein
VPRLACRVVTEECPVVTECWWQVEQDQTAEEGTLRDRQTLSQCRSVQPAGLSRSDGVCPVVTEECLVVTECWWQVEQDLAQTALEAD